MRTSRFLVVTSLFAVACGSEPCPDGFLRDNAGNCIQQSDGARDDDGDRPDEAPDERPSDDQGLTSEQCYDAGWWDCVDYFDPDPGYWACGGSNGDSYWGGYCDCEWYYDDYFWCL